MQENSIDKCGNPVKFNSVNQEINVTLKMCERFSCEAIGYGQKNLDDVIMKIFISFFGSNTIYVFHLNSYSSLAYIYNLLIMTMALKKSRDVCKFCCEYPHEREEMKIICDIFTAND